MENQINQKGRGKGFGFRLGGCLGEWNRTCTCLDDAGSWV